MLIDATRATALLRLGACTAALFLSLGQGARAETLEQLHEKARAEGALTLYGGGPARLYEGWIKEFETRFPGIQVRFVGGYANQLTPRIDREIAAHKVEVDFVTFQAVQEFVRWKHEGVLLPFRMEGYEHLDPKFRDPEGAFTPIAVFAIAAAYNTRLVSAQDAPRNALDFLKPAFRGKLITAYPADDDATMFAFYTLVKAHGWGFMDEYMKQRPRFIQGHLGVVRSIGSGESLATFDMFVHHTLADKHSGEPIDVALPTSDPMPIFGQLGAIFKESPHPNAARLYLQWYMAREQQARIGTWSARNDVDPPYGLKPILQYKVANDYAEIFTDQALLAELRKRFIAYTGEVRNVGGTR